MLMETIADDALLSKAVQIKLQYLCPYWGQEQLGANEFIYKIKESGYNGIEINMPNNTTFISDFTKVLDTIYQTNPDFIFVAQQLNIPHNNNVQDYIHLMEKKFYEIIALQPTFINSHTGKDYFSFDDNCRVIEACMNISSKTGVQIIHETHRGRFAFHPTFLLPYITQFPELKLVADYSHFCTVSESMLQGQEDILEKLMPHIAHIHARIGHEQSPQVNNPFAPEWQNHLNQFIFWWQQIISFKKLNGCTSFTITPEHGPNPYMPETPVTREPLGNQWETNYLIKEKLKTFFNKNMYE